MIEPPEPYLQQFVRRLASVLCLAVIGVGLLGGTRLSDAAWLALLGAAWLLLLISLWPVLPAALPTIARTTVRTALVLTSVFMLVGIQLLRLQVVQGDAITRRVATDPVTGEVLANARLQHEDLMIQRGRIIDRDGVVLAQTDLIDDTAYRRYPVAGLAPVTGYFSPLLYGATGLEAALDDELSGQAAGNALQLVLDQALGRPPVGNDLHLTLDAGLQQAALAGLGDRNGAVVLIELETGAVLVLASQPGFDPNALVTTNASEREAAVAAWDRLVANPVAPLVPRATQGLYTPGSTFKVITAAGVIDAGFAGPETVYNDAGMLNVDGRVIEERNRPDPTRTEWTLREGLEWSLNVVFAQIGLQLGPQLLWDYASDFGFGADIPFELPVSVSQIASSQEFLASSPAVAETAFGQGQLQATPVQMALVAAALANQGTMMAPYLVETVTAPDGRVLRQTTPVVWRQAVSPAVAGQVAAMMVDTVDTGLATNAQIPGATVGGKTGTAELGEDQAPHAWFIGFAGDPTPRYAVAVVIEYGGAGMAGAMDIGRDVLAAALAE